MSLRIDGQFFVPVWAVVEISNGTATGGLCMSLSMYYIQHGCEGASSFIAHSCPSGKCPSGKCPSGKKD